MKNLRFIVAAGATDADVHPVTQTVGALLGIIIFPWERSAHNAIKNERLAVITTKEWPTWKMSGSLIHQNSSRIPPPICRPPA